jgi:hypothetical protein
MTMGLHSIPCKLADDDTGQAVHPMKHTVSSKQVNHNRIQQ